MLGNSTSSRQQTNAGVSTLSSASNSIGV